MSVLGRFLISAAVGGLGTIFLGASDSEAKKTSQIDQPQEVATNSLSKEAVKAAIQKQALKPNTP